MRTIKAAQTAIRDGFVHVLSDEEEWAIQSALAANRPLLVRGEPGSGKTQLAHAAAVDLKRPLVSLTVDSSTESRELMWTFDAVQRLAEAQVLSATCQDENVLREQISVKKFVRPGPVWWAYDWSSAAAQLPAGDNPPPKPAGWQPTDGVVLLIDEIDKAEIDVPNGLLEALGARQFRPQGWSVPVSLLADAASPLVVITTNEERVLPNAFVRRCFVLHLSLPENDDALTEFLMHRGQAHFPDASAEIIRQAAELLVSDRRRAIDQQQQPLPGQAEYLDLVRAVMKLCTPTDQGGGGKDVAEVFEKIAAFVFKKSRETLR